MYKVNNSLVSYHWGKGEIKNEAKYFLKLIKNECMIYPNFGVQ